MIGFRDREAAREHSIRDLARQNARLQIRDVAEDRHRETLARHA